jgi:hypothetical protein
MSGSVNKVIIIGNLARDPEVRSFQNGGKVVNLRIATSEHWKDKSSGERKERTEWHAVSIFNEGIGKIAELASGYRGWVNAWLRFGAAEHFRSEAEIKNSILKWRAASPAIVEFWGGQWREVRRYEFVNEYYGLEGAAVQAILHPGEWFPVRSLAFWCNPVTRVLHFRMPSGEYLYYHNARLADGVDRYSKKSFKIIVFDGIDSTPGKPHKWGPLSTHGGKLTENAVQKVARDLFANGLLSLDDAGYPVVLHSHDEPMAEVPEGWGSVGRAEHLMMAKPWWAADWPLKASGGWRGKFYKK